MQFQVATFFGAGMKILVTGAAGFLGSNLVLRLLSQGHTVIGIDDYSNGSTRNLADAFGHAAFKMIEGDVAALQLVDCCGADVDVLVHLAAKKIPRYGGALQTLKVNYHGTDTILEYARVAKCRCVVASTSDVYGMNPDLPFDEDSSNCVIGSSQSPRWAYAVSKLFDEHLALAYEEEYEIPVVVLRFFGSYGPNQPISWLGGPPPVFIEKILKGETVPIHGDGLQTRSFTYVSDTIDGIEAAMFEQKACGQIINIGSDEEVTILELARRIKQVSDTPGELRVEYVPYESFTGRRYQDVRRRVPDTRRCESLLGVRAKVSLDQGLMKTIAWQRTVMGL